MKNYEDIRDNDNSLSKFYFAALATYSRIISNLFYNRALLIKRPIKVLINTCQFHLLLLITGACTWVPTMSNVYASFIITFVGARLVQFFINYLHHSSSLCLKRIKIKMGILLAVSLISILGCHAGLIVGIVEEYTIKERQANEWAVLFLFSFFFEYLLWDMLIQPILIITLLRMNLQTKVSIFGAMVFRKDDYHHN